MHSKKAITAKSRKAEIQENRLRSAPVRSRVRTAVRKAKSALTEGSDLASAEGLVRHAGAELDSAARKGIIHRNAAARRKGKLARAWNAARGQAASQSES